MDIAMTLTMKTLGFVLMSVACVAADCESTTLTNGCSIPGGIFFPYTDTFQTACNRHDVCYECGGFYGIDRSTCDEIYHSDMMNICREQGWLLRRRCRKYAKIYFFAVRLWGSNNYKSCGGISCDNDRVDDCLADAPRSPTFCSLATPSAPLTAGMK